MQEVSRSATMKVHKVNAPLLVIGLGGTGFDAVMKIKRMFSERFVSDRAADGTERNKPPRTAYLVVDTDQSTKDMKKHGQKLDMDEFADISNSVSDLLSGDGSLLQPWEQQWLDLANLKNADFTHGAGVYRQVSRLFLFKQAKRFVDLITTVLTKLSQVDPSSAEGMKKINIIIVTGISGGTGSGTFIDIPYLIRYAMLNSVTLQNIPYDIASYVIAPDVTIAHHAIADSKFQALYSANGFAALKELDYWMNIGQHGQKFREQYTDQIVVNSDKPPYDEVTLLCSQTATGSPIRDSYDHVMDVVAEYLLHSLAGDELGQESFSYLADNDNTQSGDVYGFQSAKSNERASINMIAKPLPVRYGYRAIGAFSNAGEQQDIQNYQSLLIFGDIVEIEKNRPEMAGTAPDDFERAVLSEQLVGILMAEFKKATEWGNDLFEGEIPFDMVTLASCDELGSPHGNRYTEWEKRPRQEAEAFRRRAQDELWASFMRAAKAVIEDEKQGPAYLEALLRNTQNGFVARLENEAERAAGQERDARDVRVGDLSSISGRFKDYQQYARGIHPFKKKESWQLYMATASELYEATQMELYFQSWNKALAWFADAVRQYMNFRLKYYNIAIDTIYADLKQRDQLGAHTGNASIVNRLSLHQRIREEFEDEQRRLELRKIVLGAIADLSFVERQVEEDEAAELLVSDLTEFIRTSFAGISNMSMEVMMSQFGNLNGMDVDEYVRDRLAPEMTRAAMPMISVTPDYSGLPYQKATNFCYISIPQSAQAIADGVEAFKRTNPQYVGATVKRSSFADRIFWLNSAAGLPLACYSSLKNLEKTYEENKRVHPALHLHMDTGRTRTDRDEEVEDDDQTMRDWSLLPSPVPTRTAFGNAQVDPILEQAEALGLLEIKYGVAHDEISKEDAYSYSIYAIPSRIATEITRQEMQGLIDEAMAESTPGRQLEALTELRKGWLVNDDLRIERTCDKCQAWATVLKARTPQIGEDILRKPDAGTSPVALARAKNAWDAAYKATVYEWIGRQPRLMHRMARHVRLATMLKEQTDIVKGMVGEAVYESAKEVIRLVLFDQLDVMPTLVRYRDSQGNLEHAGRDNELFDSAANVHSGGNYDHLPILVRLTDWYYANENSDDMRLRVLARNLKEQEREVKQMRTKEDAAALIGEAKSQLGKLGESRYTLEHRAGEIDKAHYERAEKIYKTMEGELKRFAAQFEVIL